jgi:tetratricopeptide (TPR) repeat protein
MLWRYSQHLLHSYGSLYLARGEIDAALRYADECLRGAEATNSPKNLVKARRLRGEAFLRRGELGSAATELRIGLEIARRLGNPPQLWRTLAATAALRDAEELHDDARQAYAEALEIVDMVASQLDDTRLQHVFLGSAEVQALQEKSREQGSAP